MLIKEYLENNLFKFSEEYDEERIEAAKKKLKMIEEDIDIIPIEDKKIFVKTVNNSRIELQNIAEIVIAANISSGIKKKIKFKKHSIKVSFYF